MPPRLPVPDRSKILIPCAERLPEPFMHHTCARAGVRATPLKWAAVAGDSGCSSWRRYTTARLSSTPRSSARPSRCRMGSPVGGRWPCCRGYRTALAWRSAAPGRASSSTRAPPASPGTTARSTGGPTCAGPKRRTPRRRCTPSTGSSTSQVRAAPRPARVGGAGSPVRLIGRCGSRRGGIHCGPLARGRRRPIRRRGRDPPLAHLPKYRSGRPRLLFSRHGWWQLGGDRSREGRATKFRSRLPESVRFNSGDAGRGGRAQGGRGRAARGRRLSAATV